MESDTIDIFGKKAECERGNSSDQEWCEVRSCISQHCRRGHGDSRRKHMIQRGREDVEKIWDCSRILKKSSSYEAWRIGTTAIGIISSNNPSISYLSSPERRQQTV